MKDDGQRRRATFSSQYILNDILSISSIASVTDLFFHFHHSWIIAIDRFKFPWKWLCEQYKPQMRDTLDHLNYQLDAIIPSPWWECILYFDLLSFNLHPNLNATEQNTDQEASLWPPRYGMIWCIDSQSIVIAYLTLQITISREPHNLCDGCNDCLWIAPSSTSIIIIWAIW